MHFEITLFIQNVYWIVITNINHHEQSLLELIANSDLRHGLEFESNQEA